MKIAMIFDGLGTGGIERVGINYCKILKELGHNVDIYNLKPDKTEMESLYPDDVKIYHKKLIPMQTPDQYFLIVKRWWWGKYLYPILYLFVYIGLYLYRFTMGKRKEYDIAIAFSGHFTDLNFVTKRFVKSKKQMCWLHGELMEYLVIASTFGDQYRKIKNLIVLSKNNQDSCLSLNTHLDNLFITQLYNPISLDTLKPNSEVVNQLKEKYGDFLFMAARFDTDKDQESVIRAYDILRKEHNITNKLVFGGDGPMLEHCKKIVKELKLENSIFFPGNLTNIQDYYAASKVYVHSSPAEGLPTVLLEAMKYHTPIVATRSMPGVEEILCGNTYGIQCEVANPRDIANKVNTMLHDESLQKHYVAMGDERILDFSYDKIKQKLEYIINHLFEG